MLRNYTGVLICLLAHLSSSFWRGCHKKTVENSIRNYLPFSSSVNKQPGSFFFLTPLVLILQLILGTLWCNCLLTSSYSSLDCKPQEELCLICYFYLHIVGPWHVVDAQSLTDWMCHGYSKVTQYLVDVQRLESWSLCPQSSTLHHSTFFLTGLHTRKFLEYN